MAKVTPHPNVVRYHSAWVESVAKETTHEVQDFDSDSEYSISNYSDSSFDFSTKTSSHLGTSSRSTKSVLHIQMELCANETQQQDASSPSTIAEWIRETTASGKPILCPEKRKEAMQMFYQIVQGCMNYSDLKNTFVFVY